MSLVYPAAAMVALTLAVGAFVFSVRVSHIRKGLIKIGYFRVLDNKGSEVPEFLIRAGRQYDNLMQLPMLFYATIAIALAVRVDSQLILISAWLFVLTRAMHSYIHLGSNHVMRRAQAFFAGWFCIIAMWIAILIH